MDKLIQKIEQTDWKLVANSLHEKGYAVVPEFLAENECNELLELYDQPGIYRKKVVMERYRFGKGEYKYFDYPLPSLIQTIREHVYPNLVPVANLWMEVLKMNKRFPERLTTLLNECHQNNQLKPTPLILKYEQGGFNTLHQDLYGDVYFPLQSVLILNDRNVDFDGGEFVMTQHTPRAQSKAIVLNPMKGDMLIFTTNFRPVKGSRGYYRATMKHGVSEVHSGQRHTLGIIFHDATT